MRRGAPRIGRREGRCAPVLWRHGWLRAAALALVAALVATGCRAPAPAPRPAPPPRVPAPQPTPEPEQRSDPEQLRRLAEATDALAEGALEVARFEAEQIQLGQLAPEARLQAIRFFADLALASDQPVDALRWLSLLRDRETGYRAEAVQSEIADLFRPQSTATLVASAETLGGRPPAAEIWLEVARRELRSDQRERAQIALDRLDGLRLREPQQLEAERLAMQLGARGRPDTAAAGRLPPRLSELRGVPGAGGEPAQGVIGVVLPLTGPVARVAEETLQGVLLAAGIFDPEMRGALGGGLQVEVRDTRGDPARAAAAIRELSERGDVVAAIGPLLRDETQAAAREAESVGLPLLTLTRREAVAAERPEVFRLGLTRAAEAEALAEHAVDRVGIQRVAILYPRDEYGEEFRTLLWLALEERGAQIVGVAGYDPGATDFAGPIRSLVGYDFLDPGTQELLAEREKMLDRAKRLPPEEAKELRTEARELAHPDGRPIPPIIDFDALFIPDAHDKVGLIAPALAYHQVSGVRLFGSSGWHHPELMEIAGRHVEGAFFASGFDPAYPSPFVQEFSRRFEMSFGAPATVFGAQGFDAANLIQLQMLRGATTADAMRDAILATRLFPGVSGAMALEADGNVSRRPFLVGIQRGKPTSIE